ncbi:hypothetical protein BD289DRAFT_428777 [Coniella lustricola]|uniref:Uncharacterized protein n=1 Tax=Coniella lustricola TaxID=2025994 RepID=A0A2T3ADM3_9PEZI|nr:hypothetical protein BD289DRAFT_428777 [Coniella lustricola]
MLVQALSGSGSSSSSGSSSRRSSSSSTVLSRSAPIVALTTALTTAAAAAAAATTAAASTTSTIPTAAAIGTTTPPRHPRAEIELATGQVVDLKRLATHLRRKRIQARYYAHKTAAATAMRTVRPPSSFYICEKVLESTRSYIFGRFKESLRTAASIDASRTLRPAQRKWNKFLFTIRGPLCSPARFGEALVLMRRAPDELRDLLTAQPAAVLSSLFMFVVCVARCLRSLGTTDEAKQFSGVVRALLRYVAGLTGSATAEMSGSGAITEGTSAQQQIRDSDPAGDRPRYTSQHPISQLLNALMRVEDDQLYPLAVQAWKLSCQSWDTIAHSSSRFPSTSSATFASYSSHQQASPTSSISTGPSSSSSACSPSPSPPPCSSGCPTSQQQQQQQQQQPEQSEQSPPPCPYSSPSLSLPPPSPLAICSTTTSDWINFATLVPQADIPAHIPATISQVLLALQRQDSVTMPAAVDALWSNAVLIELVVAEGSLTTSDLHYFLANNVLYDQWMGVWYKGRAIDTPIYPVANGRRRIAELADDLGVGQSEDEGETFADKIKHLYLDAADNDDNNDVTPNHHHNPAPHTPAASTPQPQPPNRDERSKIMLMRSYEDAVRGLRFIHNLEDAFWLWGNREKAEQMASWRAELTGDL